MPRMFTSITMAFALMQLSACGSDEPDIDADQVGVGAACDNDQACEAFSQDSGAGESGETGQGELECLPQFSGGYCGLSDCAGNDDCPDGSACVAHDDGVNYCFRICADKAECNANRPEEVAANCSSNIVFVDAGTPGKACVPPSSG